MKQLTKEQLSDMVHDNMVSIYKSNKDELMKKVADCGKGEDDPYIAIGNAMGVLGVEILRECSQVLVETLDHVLNAE